MLSMEQTPASARGHHALELLFAHEALTSYVSPIPQTGSLMEHRVKGPPPPEDTMRSSSFLRVRHILAMSSSSSRKRCSSSRAVSTRAYSRWCRVFTFRIFSRFCVFTCSAQYARNQG